MVSEMQPGVMRAQKREIQMNRVAKILYLVKKNYFQQFFYGTGSRFYNSSSNLF
jgi:hypothetical protein